MFRDTDEALKRLQEQLLEEEEPEETVLETEEEPDSEEDFGALLEDDGQIAASGVYKNFSNDYGRNLRNYANGYQIYNADRTDTDLESFSEAVREEPRRSNAVAWFVGILLVLMALVVGAIVWNMLGLEGIL